MPKKAKPGVGDSSFSIRLPDEIMARIRAIAEDEGRPMARVMRRIIKEGLRSLYGPVGTVRFNKD